MEGKTLLVIVDAHSKWIDTHIVPSTSSTATINKLRFVFSIYGLPKTIVSDNGPSFTSQQFKEFLQHNGIEHLRSPPYHPSSNGLAERAVQTVKEGVRKMTGPLETKLTRFLFKYRVTPQATTGLAPAELLMGRRLRTHLDLLYPSVSERVRRNQENQEKRTAGTIPRDLKVGSRVVCRNFMDGPKWVPGEVIERDTTTSVKVRLDDGRIWRRHLDHVLLSQVTTRCPVVSTEDLSTPPIDPARVEATPQEPHVEIEQPSLEQGTSVEPVTFRRSTRSRRPPERFEEYPPA